MDGRESLWKLLSEVPAGCRLAIKRACLSIWNRCAVSPRAPLLPGAALFAGTNTFALLLLWHAESATVRQSPAGLLLVATALALAGLAQMGTTLLATAGWRATAFVNRVVLGLAIAFPGVVLAGFGLRSSPPGAVGALMVTLLAVYWLVVVNRSWVFPADWLRTGAQWILELSSKEKDLMPAISENDVERPARLAASTAEGMHPVLWIQRVSDACGTEQLEGLMRVEFPPGQSMTTVHVAFCPPFRQTPAFRCEVVGPDGVRVRTSVAYAYGARVELKRSAPVNNGLEVELEFRASAARELARAA